MEQQIPTPQKALDIIDSCKKNKKIKLLDLHNLDLRIIPPELNTDDLDHITTLRLSDNKIVKIEGLNKLSALSILSLRDNLITRIEGLDNLTQLTTLHLYNNKITKIEGLDKLTRLTILKLYGNQINTIEGLEKMGKLVALHFGDNKINNLQGLDTLIELTELFLDNNMINKIECLDNLKKLSILSLSHNQINEIEGIGELVRLTDIYLNYNQIDKIKGLDKLVQLKVLFLGSNKIRKIEGLDKLQRLVDLRLSNNQISKIEGLNKLIALREVYLTNNHINKIEGLDGLVEIKKLYLNYNQISEINGLEIKQIEEIEEISLSNNPIPEANYIMLDDKQAILGILKSQLQDILKPNHYLKANIIGDGRIGKTQLLNHLRKSRYIANHPETHGTNTYNYSVPNTDYKVTIWDFGGQSYHHGFHYLFIRPKDFNIVLWRNNQNGGQNYSYWLGTARHFANAREKEKYTATLLLVQNIWNKTDELINAENFIADEVIYPDSKKLTKYQVGLNDVFAIDINSLMSENLQKISDDYFINCLHQKFIEHTNQLPQVYGRMLAIKERLDNNPIEDINLTKEKFKETYAENVDNDIFYVLLQYLEFTGNILYFDKIHSLEKYVFPNPPILSKWIFETILDEKFKKENNGKISRKQLLIKIKSNEKVEIFLSLMSEFSLFFQQPHYDENDDKEDTYYIIPQFLSDNNHSFKKVLLDLLPYTFGLRFPGFLHEGKFFNFIATYGKYAKDNTAYWKYGVLFSYPLTHQFETETSNVISTSFIQVLAYYLTDKREIIIHIEDKKGRSKVARELFDFFLIGKTKNEIKENVKIVLKDNDGIDISEQPEQMVEILKLRQSLDIKLDFNKLNNEVELSTSHQTYFDIKETAANIAANNYFGICTKTNKRVKLDFMAINLLSNEAGKKLRVFFSYSHKDEMYRDELEKHLTMVKRSGRIETWHDRKIVAGDNWDNTIKEQLEMADIVLLMISVDFIHSDYIWEQELKIINERYDANDGIRVVPIFVRPCDTEGFKFMELQGGLRDNQGKLPYISSSLDRDATYTDIVKELKTLIQSM